MKDGKESFSVRVRREACGFISDSGMACVCEASGFFAGCRCAEDDGVELILRPAKRGREAAERIADDIKSFLSEIGADDDGDYYEADGRIFLRGELASTMRQALRMLPDRGDEELSRAFFRGLFIGGGTVSDPKNQRYLDVSSPEKEPLLLVRRLLEDYGIGASVTRRSSRWVLYIKKGDSIADVLKMIGATGSAMYYEDALCEATASNMSNRTYNCYSANVKKFITRKLQLREMIRAVDPECRLDWAPRDMKETAAALLDDDREVLSLTELGGRMSPPIGKSGASHRLAKLEQVLSEQRRR